MAAGPRLRYRSVCWSLTMTRCSVRRSPPSSNSRVSRSTRQPISLKRSSSWPSGRSISSWLTYTTLGGRPAAIAAFHPVTAGIPLLLLTGSGAVGSAAEIGVRDIIFKPFDIEDLLSRMRAATEQGEDRGWNPHIGERRVLVVEDDPALCLSMATVLELEGFAVRSAGNGLEALAEVRHQQPGVVVLDLRMPVMTGMQLVGRLHAEGRHPAIVVVSGDRNAPAIAQELGAVGCLTKPFKLADLLQTVAYQFKTAC